MGDIVYLRGGDGMVKEGLEHTGEGYLLLARSTYKNSSTWQNLTPEQKIVMITLLMMANHKDNKWWDGNQFVTIHRGQLITSLDKITKAAGKGITVNKTRTALKTLEKMRFLTNQSTKQYRLITIVNYDFYQTPDNYFTKQNTKRSQSGHKAVTTNNNGKNVKNDNKKDNIPYCRIIEYLNNHTGKKFRSATEKTKRLINARYSEGFTEEDFKQVIETKTEQWKGTDMDKYLRPETLFSTKFESYLNENTVKKDDDQDMYT